MNSQFLRGSVVFAFQLLQTTLTRGQEPAVPLKPDTQGEQVQPASRSVSKPDGHLSPAYQMFARQAAVPSISMADQTTLNIGGKTEFHLCQTPQTTQEKALVAEQLQVPVGTLTNFLQRFLTNAPPATDCASQFRTAIIDYKYLREKWTQYRPPPGNEKVKTEALDHLEAGEIEKAWEMFLALPRPQPPGGLRVQRND